MKALLVLLFLAGCGSGGEDNNNHGYGFQYDSASPQGLKLRGGLDPAYLETLYAETETCTGLSAPPPFVIIVAPDSLGGGKFNGTYMDAPPLILLDPTHEFAAKHEFIHYLMDMVQHVVDQNHTSPLFAKCS